MSKYLSNANYNVYIVKNDKKNDNITKMLMKKVLYSPLVLNTCIDNNKNKKAAIFTLMPF